MPTSMSLAQATESFPLDFSKIMEARTEAEYETAVHDSIRSQLQSANLISPTSNITNFNLEPEDDRSWFDSMRRTIMKTIQRFLTIHQKVIRKLSTASI